MHDGVGVRGSRQGFGDGGKAGSGNGQAIDANGSLGQLKFAVGVGSGVKDKFGIGGLQGDFRSGDRAMLCAAVGRFDYGIDALMMGTRQSEHYLAWARPFYDTVRGAVGYVDGRICHLWHGDLVNRRYSQRHEGLAPFGFDPFTDIMIDPNGCWRWTGRKTEMQEYVRGYFESRKEDG